MDILAHQDGVLSGQRLTKAIFSQLQGVKGGLSNFIICVMGHAKKSFLLSIEFSNTIKKMDENFGYLNDQRWMRVGDLMIDLPSMEKGFHDEERRRQEIWDYIQYRESLLKWPCNKEEARKNA